jgi:3-oxoacyl-[acyl-carrier-protein] synthase II
MRLALQRAAIGPDQVDIVSTHATATETGDIQEATAIRQVFGDFKSVHVNNTKSFIGHCMGAAGALELAGNLGSFDDGMIHPTINLTDPDSRCAVRNLVAGEPRRLPEVRTILNNSFGMLGINSAVVVGKYTG